MPQCEVEKGDGSNKGQGMSWPTKHFIHNQELSIIIYAQGGMGEARGFAPCPARVRTRLLFAGESQ